MDRWRSGTPETCHSSHHHAICTRSLSLSLSLQVFFLLLVSFALPVFFFRCIIHSFIHLPLRHFCHTPCLLLGSVFFSHSLVPPTMFSSVLWQSFLGFITSSGDIPPFFSPFLPLLYPLRSLHFHFLWLQEGEKRGSLSFCFLCHLDCSERKDVDRGKEAGKVKKRDRRKSRSGKPNDRVNQRKNFQEENFKNGKQIKEK